MLRHRLLLVLVSSLATACSTGEDGLPGAGFDTAGGDVTSPTNTDASGGVVVAECDGAAAGAECEADQNPCTLDSCDGAGKCRPTGGVESCAAASAADPCWAHECDPASGCRPAELRVGAACDDGDPCTLDDRCAESASVGACAGTPIDVDDGNPCTNDYCDSDAVHHAPLDAVSCVPEAACEVPGECVAGVCMATRECPCVPGVDCPEPVCTVPCANGGKCVADDTCDCGETGYAGAACETPVCDPSCAHGACTAPDTCDCGDTGYAGAACDVPVCDPPCAHGACTAPDTCDCGETGYAGAACDVPVCDTPCAHGACTAPDTCDCGDTGYAGAACDVPVCDPPCAAGACIAPDLCECGETGYAGPTCDIPVCDPPCANGTCTAPDTCECGTTGFSGPTCATPVCDPPCANGTCTAPDTCECGTTGFSGPTCATPVCDPPCANGTCTAPDTCECGTTGFSGPTCATPVCDPPCANGSCTAPDTCECGTTGFSGPTCATPVCDPLCANGTCTAPDTCECGTTGFSGPTCATPVCDPPCANGTCTAPDTCECGTTGFSGPACATPVCDPPCANGTCTAPDSCECGTTGFSGPTCATPVCDPPCANGTCTAPDTCECGTTGFSGPTCATPVCDPPCANGSCTAPDTCECGTTGFSGPTCATPVCDPPCANGTCTAPDTCECGTTGFSGPTCATPVCDPPCANGTCTAPDTCDCEGTGYDGALCDEPICTTPCANGGTCSAPDTCDCEGTGYDGATCDEPICTTPCENGGTCTAPDTCDCEGTGYDGAICATPVCTPPCANGNCVAPDTCDCEGTGYDGALCDEPICTTPCENGGTCSAPDTCDCDGSGYTGATCELPACDPPCENGGVCIATNVCSCAGTGFDLPNCATSTCEGQPDGAACDTLNGCDAADTCEGGRCMTSPEPGVWVSGRALPAPRGNHVAALVGGSRVVIAGGRSDSAPLSSTLIYEHATSSWRPLGALSVARNHAESALLGNGRLLVAGGRTTGATASAAVDLFDPTSELWTSAGALSTPRYHHALITLSDGDVLAIGGFDGATATPSVERYEPTGNYWAPTSSMFQARSNASAALLPDGRVLVVGGDLGPQSGQALASAEAFDPATGTWEPLPPLPKSITSSSLLSSDGAIYLVGGSTTDPSFETLNQAWLFDALAEPDWQILASLTESREAPAVFLGDGDLFVAGGAWFDAGTWRHRASTERLDAVNDHWNSAAPLAAPLSGHTLTALPDGVVLRVGGFSGPSATGATATTDVALYYAGCGAAACIATPPDEVCSPPVLEPTCNPACESGGLCVAPNLCDCAGTGFEGDTCSDSPTISWTRTFGTTSEDYGGQSGMLSRTHDGHFVAVGGTTSTDSDGDGYLIKVDGAGALLDSRTYGGTASDSFSAITRFGTGYAACGSSRSSGGSRNRGWCVTLGSNLASTSSNPYGGTDLTNLFDVTATSDGHFVSAGNTTDTDAWLDMVVRKHDATGAEVWKKYFARSRDDTAYNVLAFSGGGYLITGFTGGWSSCQQYYAVRLDASGTKTWERTYGSCSASSQGTWHQLRQVVETADGGFVGTGSTVIGGARSVFLQKFAADGASQWQRTFGGANSDYGAGLVTTSDGGYAIVGWTNSFGAGGDDIYLIRTTSDGTLLWQRTFGGTADEQGLSILAMADGGFMLAGSTRSWGAGGADIVIIRTDVDGNAPAPIQCTPSCQNGGTCVATNQCDCTGTGYFGSTCQYAEFEYVNAWTKNTEPRVTALNAQATVGTLSWHRLVGAVSYKVWRYSGANYARQLETTVTTRTYDASTGYAYRIEAIGAGDVILDFVNVGISTIVAGSWTTGTFTDDFTDGVLAPNYLNLKPHQVSESGGYLQLTQTVTDDYPAFYLPYDTQGKRYFKVTARLYQYRSNSQYTGGIFYFPTENNWKNSYFGSPWEDYRSWRGGQFRHTRYRGNPPTDDISPVIALDSTSRFGSWFDYQITFDTVAGTVVGSLGGDTFPAHFPMQTQFLATGKILIYFTCYGWFTGHYLRVDDLRVESYD